MNSTSRSKGSNMGKNVVNDRICRRHALHIPGIDKARDNRLGLISVVLALLAIMVWSYWPTMTNLFNHWQDSDDYSAGQLVPLIAAYLVWRERKALSQCLLVPCWWGGIALLILAETARIYGFIFMRPSVAQYALVLTAAGLILMVAGWQVFRRVSWILLFLSLMVPFPERIHNMISLPLQRMATTGSVFLLEVFGAQVSQQGNIVILNENTHLAVAEACSGLRLLTAFIVVAAFFAYMVKRSRVKKAILVLSSIPFGVICNIVRIFVTAMLMLFVSTELGEKFFHDFAGLVMMPAAVLLMFGELWLMDRLVVPEPGPQQKQEIVRAKSTQPSSARPS